MATFRVFVTRHYIAVDFFDIESTNKKQAERDAEKAINALRPDTRAEATDNHWHSDEGVEIDHLGSSAADFSDNLELVFKTGKSKLYKSKDLTK
jgi:hypothetical protein